MELDNQPSHVKQATAAPRHKYGYYLLYTIVAIMIGLLGAGTAGFFAQSHANAILRAEIAIRDSRVDTWSERYSDMLENYIDLAKMCNSGGRR